MIMKKIIFWLSIGVGVFSLILSGQAVFAQNAPLTGDDRDGEQVKLEILPKAEWDLGALNQQIINNSEGKSVRESYNEIAARTNTPDQVDEQIASGIMTRDTLINYGILLLRFLSQVGLMIGWLMFVYVGYQYIMSVLWWSAPDESLITNAVIGILIIIFSYAIIRILTRAFLT